PRSWAAERTIAAFRWRERCHNLPPDCLAEACPPDPQNDKAKYEVAAQSKRRRAPRELPDRDRAAGAHLLARLAARMTTDRLPETTDPPMPPSRTPVLPFRYHSDSLNT